MRSQGHPRRNEGFWSEIWCEWRGPYRSQGHPSLHWKQRGSHQRGLLQSACRAEMLVATCQSASCVEAATRTLTQPTLKSSGWAFGGIFPWVEIYEDSHFGSRGFRCAAAPLASLSPPASLSLSPVGPQGSGRRYAEDAPSAQRPVPSAQRPAPSAQRPAPSAQRQAPGT